MKKLFYGAIALLALAGCTNDDFSVPEESIKSVTSINATIEEAPITRVYFEDEVTLKWNDGDRIGVYSDIQSEPSGFTFNSGETTGTFSGYSVNYKKTLYAYYPYYEAAIDEETPTLLHVNIRGNYGSGSSWNDQGMIDYSISDNYYWGDAYAKAERLIMVAKSNTKDLTFKQTMGILKFSMKGTNFVVRVEFRGNDCEVLSGDAIIDMSKDEPIVEFTSEQRISNSLVVDYRNYLNETEATDFYFRVPAITFEKGFTFIIYYRDDYGNINTLEKVVNKPLTVKRGFLKAYAGLDTDSEIKEQEEQRLEELRIQREALEAFYDALDGDNWDNHENWKTDAPLSEWYGLRVNNGLVKGIDLRENNLVGAIPAELGNISTLEQIELSWNSITSFPENISLPQMKWVMLAGNLMSGPLPESFANMPVLQNLHLDNNLFEGEIPNSYFTNLTNLDVLLLYNNKLTGTITRELQTTPMWQHAKQKNVAHQQDGYGINIEGAVMEIQLNKHNLTLLIGGEERLFVTAVLPEDALNKDVEWEINWMDGDEDNPTFILDENGVVTGVNEGEGIILVRASDRNGALATCHVRVVKEQTTGEAEDFNGSYHDWEN